MNPDACLFGGDAHIHPHNAHVITDYVLSEQLHDLAASTRDVDPNGPLAFMLKIPPLVMQALAVRLPSIWKGCSRRSNAKHRQGAEAQPCLNQQ